MLVNQFIKLQSRNSWWIRLRTSGNTRYCLFGFKRLWVRRWCIVDYQHPGPRGSDWCTLDPPQGCRQRRTGSWSLRIRRRLWCGNLMLVFTHITCHFAIDLVNLPGRTKALHTSSPFAIPASQPNDITYRFSTWESFSFSWFLRHKLTWRSDCRLSSKKIDEFQVTLEWWKKRVSG